MRLSTLGITLCSILLVACSSNGSDKSSSSNNNNTSSAASNNNAVAEAPANPQTLIATGDDADVFGRELVLSHFAYRAGAENAGGVEQLLIATNDAQLRNIVVSVVDSVDPVLDLTTPPQRRIILNIIPFGLSMRIDDNDNVWMYSRTCTDDLAESGAIIECSGITFDPENRTLVFDSFVVENTSEDSSIASAPIELNGTLQWSAADEKSIASSGNTEYALPPSGVPASLDDLQGVWDTSTNEDGGTVDEFYRVIEGSRITDFDYDGDSFDNGENCYYIDGGSVTDLGEGLFRIEYDFEGDETIYIYRDGDRLVTASGEIERSNLSVSDLVPEC